MEREPEWDDATRELVEGFTQYGDECCSGCDFHKSVIDDFANRNFAFEVPECPVCAAVARYSRVLAEQDDAATPKDRHGQPAWSSPRDPRPGDGRHLYIRELTPTEVEQRRRKREG